MKYFVVIRYAEPKATIRRTYNGVTISELLLEVNNLVSENMFGGHRFPLSIFITPKS